MKTTLKTLVLCAGLLALAMPAFAQSEAPAQSVPSAVGGTPVQVDPHFLKAPAPAQGSIVTPQAQAQTPSYDQVKGAFQKLAGAITTAINGPQTSKAIADLQSQIDGLSKLQQDYVAAKGKPGVTQAELDAIVAKYVAQVKSIQQSYSQLAHEQQAIVQAVNYGLQALAQVDQAKAQSDPDIQSTVAYLQKQIDSKFSAPMQAAETAVGPVLQATQSAVQARMPAIINEELTRAVSNQLESAAAQ